MSEEPKLRNGTLATIAQLVLILGGLLGGFWFLNTTIEDKLAAVQSEVLSIQTRLTNIEDKILISETRSDRWTRSDQQILWERLGRLNPELRLPEVREVVECR